MLAPQLVDEPLGRNGLRGMKDKQCEQGAAAAGRQHHAANAVPDLHRAQNPELHPSLLLRIDRSPADSHPEVLPLASR
jgi:hypothetical protein